MPFLSARGLSGLKNYKYQSAGYTLLDDIHQPFWNCKQLYTRLTIFAVVDKQPPPPTKDCCRIDYRFCCRDHRAATPLAGTQPHYIDRHIRPDTRILRLTVLRSNVHRSELVSLHLTII